ncbi:hypothetical protein ACIBTP_27150 [Streptomyces avidinii]|uniref:hypothetical protein n=1 Tax=Streptomyces avidinii TaxID=1895 RepID=UPI0037B3459C
MRDLRYQALFLMKWRPLVGRLLRAVDREDARALPELMRELDAVPERDDLPRWGRDVMRRVRGIALLECSKVLRDPALLDRAVDLARAALMEGSTTWEAESLDRSLLAEALAERFEQRGDQQDVDDAITAYRQAWDLCRAADAAPRMPWRKRLRRSWREFWSTEGARPWPPLNKGAKVSTLMSLGDVLFTRFAYLRILDDLHEAVRVSEEAEAYTRTWGWALSGGQGSYGHGRGIALSQYAALLVQRYELFGEAEDIVRAVWLFKDADRLLPRRDDEGPRLARNRVHALTTQGRALRRVEDFTKAASVLRRRAPRDAYWLPQVEILTGRAGVEGSTDGLGEAVDILEAAAGQDGPDTHEALIWLASTLRQWAAHLRDNPPAPGAAADPQPDVGTLWRRSDDAWRRAARREAAPAHRRLHAASRWSAQSARAHPGSAEAAEASALAVRLLPLAAWRGLDRLSQERGLKSVGFGLATGAAADQLAQGDPAQALELLELGRGVLWSQKLDGRTDLKLLGHTSPELAESLTRVRVLLEEARDPSAHTGRVRLLPPP